MPDRCVAANCSNTPKPNAVVLYAFPSAEKRKSVRQKWINFVRVRRANFSKATPSSMLCSEHFLSNDFTNKLEFDAGANHRLYLHAEAFPTVHKEAKSATAICTTGERRSQNAINK
jgi:hypothetical protein